MLALCVRRKAAIASLTFSSVAFSSASTACAGASFAWKIAQLSGV